MIDILIVCVIVVAAMVLFATEKLRVDLVALLIMTTLMLIGVFRPGFLSVQQAIAGFSNKATITIAAMFILTAGLVKTGSITMLSHRLIKIGGSNERRLFIVLLVSAGIASAFINNTAAVAVFIPIALSVSRQFKISPTRLLLPLSFISIVGGTSTLIGTSTNILVSSMSADAGVGEFKMFELTKLGAIFFGVGLVYLILFARRILPDRADPADLTSKYNVGEFFTMVVVDKKSSLVLTTPAESRINQRYDVTILEIIRGDDRLWTGLRDVQLHEGDELLVRGSIHNILEMSEIEGLTIRSQLKYADPELTRDDVMLAEAIIAPSAPMIGRSLKDVDFRNQYGVFALAIRKHGETIRQRIGNVRLDAGDTLLIQGHRDFVQKLDGDSSFLMTQEVEIEQVRKKKGPIALAIVALAIGLAAFEVLPILVSAIVGCLAMILTGCLKPQEAYESIDWFVIFLLAGVIPLGLAMENTGTAAFIANGILQVTENLGDTAIIAVFYLLSTVFASIMSHNAAAILLVPIGVASARELGLDPFPILMAITFAASSAMSTPFGYHTNLMVYGPGNYRFSDFLKVGIPLNLIFWVLSSLLIPVIWPLR
jgi:di/tricarboxylate transporter